MRAGQYLYRRRADEFMRAQFNSFHLYWHISRCAKISRRIFATVARPTGVKSLCAIPPCATFDPLRRYAEETPADLDWLVELPPPGCKWDTAARLFDSVENPFMRLPGMITRRAISRRQNKNCLISSSRLQRHTGFLPYRRYVRGHQLSGRWH